MTTAPLAVKATFCAQIQLLQYISAADIMYDLLAPSERPFQIGEYQVIGKLGIGAYGTVYKAEHRTTKKQYALKKSEQNTQDEGLSATTIREISLLKEVSHKNVVRLEDVIISDNDSYLVFELGKTDLKKHMDSLKTGQLQKKSTLEPDDVKRFMYQMLSAVAQCHLKRIMHRDLKPANILIFDGNNIKIGDFGLARTFSLPVRPYTQPVATLWYRAPEILLGIDQYTTAIDIWSLGCIFAQMVANEPIFKGEGEEDQKKRIFMVMGTPTEDVWPGVTQLRYYRPDLPNYNATTIDSFVQDHHLEPAGLNLLKRMLTYDPKTRITAKAALYHDYFKGVNLN